MGLGLNLLDPAANDVTLVGKQNHEREKTLVLQEDGRSRTMSDMVCIPVPCETNILDFFSNAFIALFFIKGFLVSVRPIRQIKIKSWTNVIVTGGAFFDILDD